MSYAIMGAARDVIANWDTKAGNNLAKAVEHLAYLLNDPDNFATEAEIQRARDEYTNRYDASIVIDEGACASHADEGVWVQAWVFLQDEPQ